MSIHLAAAYNLARRLTRHEQDAEDLVHEAYLRAFQAFARFHGDCGRAWILAIVRNTYYTWRRLHKLHDDAAPFEEHLHSNAVSGTVDVSHHATNTPE
jgi:RNA polymerase sigma factor (sigma-70 family)